jgi:uncharacterized membrane protein HdeD (DUF308 family)
MDDPLRNRGLGTILGRYTGNWWAIALRAVAAILLGILSIVMPGVTLGAIVILFGAYAVVGGVFSIVAAIRGLRRNERWGAMLAEGVFGVIAGLIVLFWPGIGAFTLTLLVAFWAFATGVFEIAAAVKLRKIIEGEWLLMLAGVLAIVFGVLILMRPAMGALVLVWWLGAYLIVSGAVALALAFRVRSWTHAHA